MFVQAFQLERIAIDAERAGHEALEAAQLVWRQGRAARDRSERAWSEFVSMSREHVGLQAGTRTAAEVTEVLDFLTSTRTPAFREPAPASIDVEPPAIAATPTSEDLAGLGPSGDGRR